MVPLCSESRKHELFRYKADPADHSTQTSLSFGGCILKIMNQENLR